MNSAPHDVMSAAHRLQARHQPYALVSVLRVQAPASARPGDKAVVTADGVIDGWVGGGCAQPAVLRTVRQALLDGRARMIRISPSDDEGAPAGRGEAAGDEVEFSMRCHSGGTLELFVDPMLPPARLTLFGDSPVAAALAGLAPRVGFELTVVAPGADAERFPDAAHLIEGDDVARLVAQVAPGSFVVVATQGRRDVQGLRAALAVQARGVWFVASARKAQVLRESLLAAGESAAAVAGIVSPAGQAIGAQTPEEIALSVLAAVVAARRGVAAEPEVPPEAEASASAARPAPALVPVPASTSASTPTTVMAPTPSQACCGSAASLPLPSVAIAASCCGGA